MKGCLLEVNLEVYHFVDSDRRVERSSKREVSRKNGGVLEAVLPGKEANDISWGRKGLLGGTGVGEKLYRFTIKWTSSKTVVKDFP